MIKLDLNRSSSGINNSIIVTFRMNNQNKKMKMKRKTLVFSLFLLHLTFQPIGCDVALASSPLSSSSSQLFPSPSAAGATVVPVSSSSSSSSAAGDMCSSCRGDNSTCRVVSGIFSRPQLNVGYNLVAHIPRGACNLTITEIRKSPNHLALQRRDGTFILNGDWRLSQSGEYPGAGTLFQYKRQDLQNPEGVTAPGPILEPIDLMVLYQQPNPVIKYEYLMPAPQGDSQHLQHPLPPSSLLLPPPQEQSGRHGHHHHHHHRHSSSGISAATSRPASYVRFPPPPGSSSLILHQPQQHPAAAGGVVPGNSIPPFPPKLHPESATPGNSLYGTDSWNTGNSGRRRDGGILPSPSDKKFYWKVVAFTNCTEPCGGGLQRSIVRCVRAPAGNPVSDRRCSSEGPKPPSQTTRCNVKPCPAEWVVGEWSSCQGDCGEGFRTRPVHCQQRVSPTLKMVVAEGACLAQRPESRISCTLPRPCNHWTTSEWSQCSTRCGSGIRKRAIVCVGASGQRLPDDECDLTSKPGELTPCNMGPCEGVDWFVSEWSNECSQKCGSGIQTRHVVCSSLNPLGSHHRNKPYYYSYGSPYQNVSQYSKKRTRTGSSELETNLIDEEAGGEDGDNTIHETVENEDMNVSHCDESRRPSAERECFSERSCGEHVWFTGPWGECSVTCGTGLRTRQVLCVIFSRGKFKVATDSSLCPEDNKPEEKQVCESNGVKCPQRWFTTEWSECSALCGGGLQKRSVSCRASNWSLPSSLCFDKDRPIERRSCNEHRCTVPTDSTFTVSTTSTTFVVGPLSNDTSMFRDTTGIRPSPTSSLVSPSQSSSLSHDHRRVSSSYRPRGPPLSSREIGSHSDDEDPSVNCTDEYRNCALVVQARLCRYKYYRSVCCSSCLDATA